MGAVLCITCIGSIHKEKASTAFFYIGLKREAPPWQQLDASETASQVALFVKGLE